MRMSRSSSDLDNWVKRKVAELPRDRRNLVTSHDAFQYFARDYGFKIEAIEGVNTETEASNRHVSELIDDIKKQGVKAIFLESTLNPKVTSQITRETGAKIGGTLYADGLGPGDASYLRRDDEAQRLDDCRCVKIANERITAAPRLVSGDWLAGGPLAAS